MTLVIIVVILAVIFDYLNGFHDSSNVVATIISSRALSPGWALALSAFGNVAGPFLFGVAVAKTIGEGIVDPAHVSMEVIIATLVSAILWNLITWFFGIPSSSSHALIGGLIGAVGISVGLGAIHPSGLIKVFIALFGSPILGLVFGYLLTKLIFFLSRNAHPRINGFFRGAQVLTGIALSLSHGTNDAQKTMGIITMGLVAGGIESTFEVPIWVIAVSAAAIGLGTATGGWRLIRTLGSKFYKIRPVHGFATQFTSAGVILGAALLGGPVSTTQVVGSAIAGVGAAERVNMVRWNVLGNIVVAWIFTIPATAVVSALTYLLIKLVAP